MDIDESPDVEAHALRAVQPVMRRLGERVAARAAEEHAYENQTGELEASMYSDTDDHRTRVGSHARYSGWVEVGHFIRPGTTPRKTAHNTPPGWVYGRPFLLPALLAEAGDVE